MFVSSIACCVWCQIWYQNFGIRNPWINDVGPDVVESPLRERDLDDTKRKNLRRYVEQLQQRLQHLEATQGADSYYSLRKESSIVTRKIIILSTKIKALIWLFFSF